MKICVVTPLYAIAGVPLAQIRFSRALASKGHEVDLMIGNIHPQFTFHGVDGVNVIILECPNVRSMFFPLMKYLREEKPDVVFSAEDHLNTTVLLAAIVSGSKAKISGSSRVTPFDTYSNTPFSKRWILKQLTRAVAWRADALTCVSKDMVKQYRQVFNLPPHECIYNIVDDKQSRLKMRESVEHEWFLDNTVPVLIAAGRLVSWKGFDYLIHAIKELSQKRPVRLLIMGDGPLYAELDRLISDLGLTDLVELLGYVENPLKYFVHANVFILSSHVEGLPNVLVEAMMCGCTPVSTNCPTGPSEVLQDGKYGYLVPMRDPSAMATAIVQALDNPIPEDILKKAVEPFSELKVFEEHCKSLEISKSDFFPKNSKV